MGAGGGTGVPRAGRHPRHAPTVGELYRLGYRPETLRRLHGGWFRFVRQEGGLNEEETRALEAASDWLGDLERSAMTKSFKMVVLEVLVGG